MGESSRVVKKLSGSRATLEQVLLASVVDRLGLLLWFQTEDGRLGRKRPKSLVALMSGEAVGVGFTTGKDFEQARARLLERIKKGGA